MLCKNWYKDCLELKLIAVDQITKNNLLLSKSLYKTYAYVFFANFQLTLGLPSRASIDWLYSWLIFDPPIIYSQSQILESSRRSDNRWPNKFDCDFSDLQWLKSIKICAG